MSTPQEQAARAQQPAGTSPPKTSAAEAAAAETLDKGRLDATEPAEAQPDLLAVARLCYEFGRVEDLSDVPPLLEEAARLLEAKGLLMAVGRIDGRTDPDPGPRLLGQDGVAVANGQVGC